VDQPSSLTDAQRFEQLITARHPCILIASTEEDVALEIVRDCAMQRGCDLSEWSTTRGLFDGIVASPTFIPDTDHPAAALLHLIQTCNSRRMVVLLDIIGHLKDERTLRMLRDAIVHVSKRRGTVVLIDSRSDLPPSIEAMTTRFELSLPDDADVENCIRDTLREINSEQRIEVAVSRKGLSLMVKNLRGLSNRQVRQMVIDAVAEDLRFDDADINSMLASKRRALGGGTLLEFIESPATLDEIGGLGRLKNWLNARHNCLSEEASAFGLQSPRGVLMLGVQGAGKSLSAKAIATAWQRPLLRMDVGALYDRYIGESERRLREALRQAERMAPIILWIDEIEKAFASAASQSSDGGLSKRMFGSLLTWMQEHTAPVFLIATANDIEALPPELLRKGRFDEIFFVDLPSLESRVAIVQIHLAKRRRDVNQFDVAALAAASEGFSGAEIEQAIVSAMHEAFAAKTELTTEHILSAMEHSPPLSVTMAEKVGWLREWAQGRCVPAE
jgi:ATP-dependent 26S proteasome regulatory subunit